MNPGHDRQREKEIFLGAIALEGDARRRYVEAACRDDVGLLAAVHALLDASEREGVVTAGGLISAAGLAAAEAAANQGRERIGCYTIVGRLGEGGFGDVYLAEQLEPVSRRVALKVLKPGMDSRDVVARFEQERQALALMDHPSIAKVLDAGQTVVGRPYFVMELVIGPPITAYCRTRKLSMRERLDLFKQVCHAVQHAHSKGVIHRDLKPSNVLVAEVDGRPVPKIIDFGIAKALDSAQLQHGVFTQQRVLIGTPQYMSPEQAEGGAADVDTRSDVYSLGVLLYELLTGTTPFDGERLRSAAMGEVVRILREEDPPRASTRLRSVVAGAQPLESRVVERELRGELDWIIMKAMEKERAHRYETASEFAADITRYLSGEPVEAVPPSGLYILRKTARRHRRLVITAALVSAAVLAGSAVAVWQAYRATRAEQLQSEAAQRATRNAQLAAQHELEAQNQEREAAAQAANFKAVNSFMQEGMLRMAMPQAARGREVTLLQVVDGVAARLDAGELAGSPQVEVELRQSLGTIYAEIGRLAEAERHVKRAIEICRRGDSASDRDGLAHALNTYGVTLNSQGRYAEAVASFEESLALLRGLGKERGIFGLSVSANLGTSLAGLGEGERAESVARAALEAAAQLGPSDQKVLSRLWYSLGFALKARSKIQEAEEPLRRALKLREEARPPDPVAAADAHHLLAVILLEQRKLDDAKTHFEAAFELRRDVLGDSHADTLASLSGVGTALNDTGHPAEAEAIFARMISARTSTDGKVSPESAGALRNLASSQMDQNKLDDADATLRRALALCLASRGEADADTLQTMRSLGVLLQRKKAFTEAERYLAKAAVGLKEVLGDDTVPYAEAMRDLGIVHTDLGKAEQGVKELEISETVLADNGLGRTVTYASVLQSLSKALADCGRNQDAADVAERALRICPRENPNTLVVRSRLLSQKGVSLWRLRRPVPAEACFREVIEILTELNGENNALVGTAWDSLAAQLEDQGRFDEAESAAQHSLAIRRAISAEPTDAMYWSFNRLYNIRMKAGRTQGALEAATDEIALADKLYPRSHAQSLSARVNLGDAVHNRASELFRDGKNADALAALATGEKVLRDLVDLRERMLAPDDWRLAAHHIELDRLVALRLRASTARDPDELASTRSRLEAAYRILSVADPAKAPAAKERAAQAAESLANLLAQLSAEHPDDAAIAQTAAQWRALSPAR